MISAYNAQKPPGVLIVGAGVAGATVADRLSRLGFRIYLADREMQIGGHAAEYGCKATDVCVRCNVCVAERLFREVRSAPAIRFFPGTQLTQLRRENGDGAALCATLCETGGSESHELAIDALVLATGFEPYNPRENRAYGYGRTPNIITGRDAEHQLASTATLRRPSDERIPEKIAFIQCVGSRSEEVFRDPQDVDYCSTVCCAYALRMARRVKHETPDADITVFFMDIQHFGKDFDSFYRDCCEQFRFVRSRPSRLEPASDDRVCITYAAEKPGHPVVQETFDLAVLSVGMRPRPEAGKLAELLNIPLDDYGFFGVKKAGAMPDLFHDRIWVAGAGEAPRDIAGTIAQAEAVSADLLARLNVSNECAEGTMAK